MAFKDNSNSDGIFEINITPFVDVVLVLLVIFMVTTPLLVKQSLEVELPKTKSSDQLDPQTLTVVINAQGQYFLNGELLVLEQLVQRAQSIYENAPQLQVVFAADLNSRHQALVEVLDRLKQVGIGRFAFQVVKQDS